MSVVTIQITAAAEHEFRLEKPEAQSVELMAEFNGWKALPMKKQSDGTWTATVAVPPGTYGYKFLVNGTEWVFDPKNTNRKSVDGIENSAVEISTGPGSPAPSVGEVASFAGKPTPNPFASQAASPTAVAAKPILAPSPSATVSLTDAAPPRSATAPALAPTPGELLTLEVPLSTKRRAEAAKDKDGNTRLAHARMAIAVPPNFDPQKSWPVFVVCNTEAYSNIDSLHQFKQAALDQGWVIVAADAVEAEKKQEGGMRWPTIAAAFDYVTAAWPAAKDWPIACGGMSGGAKNSSFLAAKLAHENHRIIGMLMMGCNQDMATVAYRRSSPGGMFLTVPVFLSSGKSDTIATPAQHMAVRNSLQGTGFHKVRLESFDGAHDIYQPHITEALKWFSAESLKNNPTQRASSDFDKFFKKKP